MPFEDMEVRADPYSLPHQTPKSRLDALNQIMQNILTPMMPLLQQQGITIDINAYLQKVAQYLDMPDLVDVVTIQEAPDPAQQGGGGPEQPKMPSQTERTYTRENVSARTTRGNDLNLVNSLSGVNPGGAQRNGQTMGGQQ